MEERLTGSSTKPVIREHIPDKMMPTQQMYPEPICSPIPHSPVVSGNCSPGVSLMQPTPSPGCKRFVGISSNARNDIYMKTLMNSPYHKSYTPLSATPGYSPMYQTPIRNNNSSPLKGVAPSPRAVGSAPLSARKFVTPKGIMNPFESDIDDLNKPAYMSPGFFTISSTPASEKCFRWSIEHLAELHPVDIDEMPVQQTHSKPDRETEERAQKAIEQYFANNIIVPSPWSDSKQSKRKNVLPATPAAQGPGGGVHEMMTELQGSIQKSLPPKQGMEDAACQTTLSLPVNFDLQKVLGAYMTQEDIGGEGNQQEMLSTSSLRRKLFFHGDTSSLAPSPVKPTSGNMMVPESPVFRKQNDLDWEVTTPLKNTPAFSSSPIKSMGTPIRRRCSSDPEFLASPELSPIVHGNIPNSGIRKSRSSGMFGVDGEGIDISPVTDNDHRPLTSPVSPIPFTGHHFDGEGDEFRPKFVDSPGFSPIRQPKTPIRKILRRSQEESYIQDEGCTSEDESDSITPVSSNPNIQTSVITPVDTLSPIQKNNSNKHSFNKSQSGTNLMQTMMDYELAPTSLENRFTDPIYTSSLYETRDFSDIDYQDETHLRTNSSNQDTGYQTASLQSTNQESVSLHTNLTNQFGSLPFNLTNQDLGLQNISQVSTNKDKAPIMNLVKHFTSPGENEEEEYRVSEVRRVNKSFDKQLLPKQNLFAQNMFTSDESDSEATPKHVNLKSYSNDSAFIEMGHNEPTFITDAGNMEIDGKKAENEEFYPNEKHVLSRARQALAMANSMYPLETKSGKASQLTADSNAKSQFTASEFAFTILQKAGEDLAKYEHMFSGN